MEALSHINALRDKLPSLATRDQAFAHSLLRAWPNLSEKQMYWVKRLAAGTKPREAHELGGFDGIRALFDTAAKHLKHPAVVLRIKAQGVDVRIKPAGGRSRYPGACHVTKAGAEFGEEGAYFGRITPEGQYIAKDSNPELEALLKSFAAEPAKVAADHGRLTGRCCFCNQGLKDERSTAVGYGPICADHFGLPWGSIKGSA